MTHSIMHDRTYPLLDYCGMCKGWHIPVYSHASLFTAGHFGLYANPEIIDRQTGEVFTRNQFRLFVEHYRQIHCVIRRRGTPAAAADARGTSALTLARSAEKTFL